MTNRACASGRRLAACVGLALIALAGVSPSSAATLGGITTADLGAATATTRTITGATLEWNPGVIGRAALDVDVVRLTADHGETFTAGDTVTATVDDGMGGRCEVSAVVPSTQSTTDLAFPVCALSVGSLRRIAITVTGSGAASMISGDLGGMSGTLSGFAAGVVDPSAQVATGIESRPHAGVETMSELYLDVYDATVEELVGRRLIISIYGASTGAPPTHVYSGVVGTNEDNDGIWAEVDPAGTGIDQFPTVTADIRRIEPGGGWPAIAAVSRYEVVLLQTQHLVAPERQPSSQPYLARAVGGVVDHDIPSDGTQPDGTQPIDLDSRLSFSEPSGPVAPDNSLHFCHNFRVTNTSDGPVDWRITFDTTKPPLWGIDPRIIEPSTPGRLTSIWNARTFEFHEESGLWTLAGDTVENSTLAPGESRYAGYCARANIPPADPATFHAPQISVSPGSSVYNVEVRVDVTSDSRWNVPWEVEVDLADYVCADVLPSTPSGDNSTLTPVSGTRYLLKGSVSGGTRFVSSSAPISNLVFLRFSPGGRPFLPGTCA